MPNPKYTNKEINFKKSNILGLRITQLRTANNWSQKELAEKLCEIMDQEEAMKPLTISSYETGKRLPTLATLVGLSQLFSVSVDYLLGADVSEKKTKIEKIISEEDKETINSPIPEYDVKIPAREYEKYHGQPVFVMADGNNTVFKSRWGLLDYYNKLVLFVGNESVQLTPEYVLFRVKPTISSLLETEGVYPLNLGQLLKTENFVWVELINADAETKGLYNGYYRHNDTHSCLINISNGLTLPYSGLGISYMPYSIENAK